MTETRQFICMKWGTLYGPEYVNRLYRMIRAHCAGPCRLVCLTDDPKGIDGGVECLPCPRIEVPEPYSCKPWRKLATFAPADRLFGLSGDWLFLDLDVVICGPLEDFFSFQADEDFVVMQNWTQPGKGIGNTSVYRFRVGALAWVLEKLEREHQSIFRQFRNSQTFISRTLGAPVFWPDSWCVLFKVHCVPRWPLRFWKAPTIPAGARVIAFPGFPNPHEALEGRWPAKWYKKFYKFLLPSPWIADLWTAKSQVSSRPG